MVQEVINIGKLKAVRYQIIYHIFPHLLLQGRACQEGESELCIITIVAENFIFKYTL